MINIATVCGRLIKEIELKKTKTNKSVIQFTLACDRKYKDENGQKQADFVPCQAWGQSADFLAQYAGKGDLIGVIGTLQTGSYEKNGMKIYTMNVNCNEVQIIESKRKDPSREVYQPQEEVYQPNKEEIFIGTEDLPFY